MNGTEAPAFVSREEYDRQGFVFVPGFFSPDEVKAMQAGVKEIQGLPATPEKIIFEKDGKTIRTIVNPHLYNEPYVRLIRHPQLLGAVRHLLDDEVYVFQSGINCKAAFNGDVWFWHQDYPAYHKDDHIPLPRMVNALIFIDDINHLNSPLMLVPGSHTVNDDMPEFSDQGTSYSFRYTSPELIKAEVRKSGVVAPTGPAGSVIFMNVNLLHGSTANLSPWSRTMMTLTYNAFSNKATSPSVRPRHIVYDDSALPALTPLAADCLSSLARETA